MPRRDPLEVRYGRKKPRILDPIYRGQPTSRKPAPRYMGPVPKPGGIPIVINEPVRVAKKKPTQPMRQRRQKATGRAPGNIPIVTDNDRVIARNATRTRAPGHIEVSPIGVDPDYERAVRLEKEKRRRAPLRKPVTKKPAKKAGGVHRKAAPAPAPRRAGPTPRAAAPPPSTRKAVAKKAPVRKAIPRPAPAPRMPPARRVTPIDPRRQQMLDRQRAEDLVSMEFDPLRNELDRAIRQIEIQRGQDIGTQVGYGILGDVGLRDVYSTLGQQLQGGVGRIEDVYNRAREQTGQAYGETQQAVAGATGQVQGELEEQARRLGLTAALPGPTSELQSELAGYQAREGLGRAGAVGNLANLGADVQALAETDVMAAGREGAQQRGNLARTVARGIAEAQRTAGQALYENYGELGDVAQQRGAALRNAYQDVVESRTERERQTRLDRLAEEIQRNTMQLQGRQQQIQEQQFGLQREESAFNRQMALQELSLQRRQLEAELAAATSPEAQLATQLDLMRVEAEIGKIQAQTGATQQRAALEARRAPLTEANIRSQIKARDTRARAGPTSRGEQASALQRVRTYMATRNISDPQFEKDVLRYIKGGDRAKARRMIEADFRRKDIDDPLRRSYINAVRAYLGELKEL